LKKFAEWLSKAPDDLVEMQKAAKNHAGDLRENRVLEGKVKGYMRHLEENGSSIGTRKLVYSSILSFFENNLYPLDMLPNDRPTGESRGSRIPEKKEINKIWNASKSRRYRAAILFLKDSGLRISDVVRLTWEDKEDFGEGFWGWRILTKKRKVQATSFVGPETTEALSLLDNKTGRIFPVHKVVLGTAINQTIHAAGIKDLTAHGLRKFFNAELQAARIPKEWRYQMMGKKTSVYDENRISKLFEAYREAYGYLQIHSANAELVDFEKKIKDLRKENEKLREKLNGQAEKIRQIENAENTIEFIKKEIDNRMKELHDPTVPSDLDLEEYRAFKRWQKKERQSQSES
jgi:integrase